MKALFVVRFELERLRAAVRASWRRILVGAFAGWVLASVLGALALIGLEEHGWISLEDSNVAAAAIAWAGVGLGALTAYAIKPTPKEEP